ncbi:hypothetical protein Poli38472_009673 [Pythium oligandrum]|uniref:Ricin B lectin domain-containing protein n=1 Tax=Pythium oligandrum TaxID=41045 RepID=A0A8K1CG86_PYTOL|nr:hypothetical protein Poli38472_009673 [Pythium oligandrum]|eukprot:TMW62180.1 hypothetical protein Poli38472_009673 [Pythium oligandrum]
MAGGNSNRNTAYGTSSLASDDNLAASTRRRRVLRFGITALTVAAALAVIAYGFSRHGQEATEATTGAGAPVTAKAPEAEVVVPAAVEGAELKVWQSSYLNNETKMMEPISGLKWAKKTDAASVITVDDSKKFQEIFGFGGAFTEASALQFEKLSKEKQEEVLKLYFDKEEGSGYEFGRVPMGSCDFSVSSYSFAEVANDTELTHFDTEVTHDTKILIPFIKRALEKNPKLKLFLAPWSPPAWMKQGDPAHGYEPSMLGSAAPNGLNPDYRAAWALYFSKYITAYKNQGIPFWGLTPQNEPEFAAPWEACLYKASYQADFVGEFLGPVIRRDHPDVKIMIFDHNRASVLHWAQTIYNHPKAKDYVDGMAFHWYDDERYMDGVEFHERLNDTHYVDENRFMLATESCNCPGVAKGDDAWFRAQRYAHDILTDFNNWVVGWVDWNLILDHTGGPNHLGNNCDAPIIIDETEKDYFIQPMYYFIQHFSKYVPAGSRRIHTEVAARFEKPGDAQLYPRYPAALHPCDGSSRQQIHVTDDSKLQITGTEYCIDLLHPQWEGGQVELVKCIYTSQKWTFINGQIRMLDNHCLHLHHQSTESGVRVTTRLCKDDADYQKWDFKDGTMRSLAAPDKCVTAGYSFVQATSFVTPENKKVTVVLNENTEDATFELQHGDVGVEVTLPRGAIRTFVWE